MIERGTAQADSKGAVLMSQWIPLMDYSMKKGISLSTLRRHIKSKKIPFKIENGRYLLPDVPAEGLPTYAQEGPLVEPAICAKPLNSAEAGVELDTAIALVQKSQRLGSAPAAKLIEADISRDLSGDLMVRQLTIELKKAHEEIAELKTLIAFYEESLPELRADV